jgi:hypothetical protein
VIGALKKLGAPPSLASEAARIALLGAMDALVESGVATWHQLSFDHLELRCTGGEAWLLDRAGITRLR